MPRRAEAGYCVPARPDTSHSTTLAAARRAVQPPNSRRLPPPPLSLMLRPLGSEAGPTRRLCAAHMRGAPLGEGSQVRLLTTERQPAVEPHREPAPRAGHDAHSWRGSAWGIGSRCCGCCGSCGWASCGALPGWRTPQAGSAKAKHGSKKTRPAMRPRSNPQQGMPHAAPPAQPLVEARASPANGTADCSRTRVAAGLRGGLRAADMRGAPLRGGCQVRPLTTAVTHCRSASVADRAGQRRR